MLELIIERGMQILQTTEGEKLPRVIETLVRQKAAEPGLCQFTMFVDAPGLCKYNDLEKTLTTPGGLKLRHVEVLKYKPMQSPTEPAKVLCQCHVAFHYDTKHKAHYTIAQQN